MDNWMLPRVSHTHQWNSRRTAREFVFYSTAITNWYVWIPYGPFSQCSVFFSPHHHQVSTSLFVTVFGLLLPINYRVETDNLTIWHIIFTSILAGCRYGIASAKIISAIYRFGFFSIHFRSRYTARAHVDSPTVDIDFQSFFCWSAPTHIKPRHSWFYPNLNIRERKYIWLCYEIK